MTWNDSFRIGISQIDAQHKELCDKIDVLYDACAKGKGKEELMNVLHFLQSYTVTHFQDEENLQIQVNYPEVQAHKALHHAFVNQMSELIDEIKISGADISLVLRTLKVVSAWLVGHILSEDKKIEEFAHSAV